MGIEKNFNKKQQDNGQVLGNVLTKPYFICKLDLVSGSDRRCCWPVVPSVGEHRGFRPASVVAMISLWWDPCELRHLLPNLLVDCHAEASPVLTFCL